MVPALGIASSLLSDVGYKAMKGLVSGKSSGSAGVTLPAGLAGAVDTTGQNVPAQTLRNDLNGLFAKVDTDGDGSLSKQEFLDFKQKIDQSLSALLKTQENAAQTGIGSLDSKADQLFAAADENGDGKISASEFAKALHPRHHHHADAAAAGPSTSSSSADDTGQGTTSPAAFLTALLNLQASS